ncbi:hypothetical protein TWF718_003564 [Orbilia javanica]|uniref:Uncharacterized protein n=1 Tax=Orbilia javanica TaxID=47235 RepID=A0AAN8R9X2_9PEZI
MGWNDREKYDHKIQGYDANVVLANKEYQNIVDQVNHIPVKIRGLILDLNSTIETLEDVVDEGDADKMKDRLMTATEPFHKMLRDVENAHTEAGDLHIKFKELLTETVLPLDIEIHNLEKELGIITDNQGQVARTAQNRQQQEQRVLESRQEAFQDARRRLSELKRKRNGFFRAVVPFYSSIEDRGINMAEEKVRELEELVLQQQRNANAAQAAANKENNIWREMGLTGNKAKRVGGLADSLIDHMTIFQARFTGLKDALSEVILLMSNLDNLAKNVEFLFDKKEFLGAVIDICAAGLIDPRLEEHVRHIHKKVCKIYQNNLPFSDSKLKERLKEMRYAFRLEVTVQLAMLGAKGASEITEGIDL